VPVGAEVAPSGVVHFRVWAPEREQVEVVIEDRFFPLQPEDAGYFAGLVDVARAGSLYKYRLDGKDWFPDPASRFQPQGVHGFSQVIDPGKFSWTDSKWRGAALRGQVVYEMHIGTFTREGTWASATRELPNLAELGISVLEVMPVSEFPGEFGWGYDGVYPYAPTRLYGAPDDFRRFVDEAHRLGMAVVLDVVYNHLGPEGNYFGQFSKYYFTALHTTDWGEALNFYGEQSDPSREYFISNAAYWIDEFHLDGLRLDATQNIYDESKDHILAAISRAVRKAAKGRETIVVGENEPQEVRLVRDEKEGGYGIDGLWNDDLHHSMMVRITGHNEAYYSDYQGSAQEMISAAKYGYLYQGQWYQWQKQRRGSATFGLPPWRFVNFTQNHDQVANSARGLRAHQLTSPGIDKAMTAFFMLAPGTPMLFQGQEFAASSPFLFFADQGPELAPLIHEGRRKFLSQFRSLALKEMWGCFAPPEERSTFEKCKLDHAEREAHAETYALYRDLIRLRKSEEAFRRQEYGAVDGAVLNPDAFVLRFFAPSGDDRLVIVNFGKDLHFSPAPEPLLAPPEDKEWNVIWSSENPSYGGCGTPPLDTVENWRIPGQSAVVLRPADRQRTAFTTATFEVLP
jgi:maltooligosyltrehalose trehalohydrolase